MVDFDPVSIIVKFIQVLIDVAYNRLLRPIVDWVIDKFFDLILGNGYFDSTRTLVLIILAALGLVGLYVFANKRIR